MFSEVRRIESFRVEGMEIYSTTLWHLQKDVALSALSKDLTDMDKNCPEVRGPLSLLFLSVSLVPVFLITCLSLWFFWSPVCLSGFCLPQCFLSV